MKSTAWIAALALVMAACGGTPGADPDAESGVPRLVHVATIGCGDCDGPEALVPASVSVANDRILIRDKYEPLLRVFNPEGDFAFGFGVEGQGPGELENLVEMPAYAADDGAMFAYGMTKLDEFGATGSYGESHAWPMFLPHELFFEPESARLFVLAAPPPFAPGPRVRSVELVVYDPRGEDFGPRTVLPAEALPYADEDPDRTSASNLVVRTDGTIILADSSRYLMYEYDSAGQLQRSFGRDVEAPRLTAREIEIQTRMGQQLGNDEVPAERGPHFGSHSLHLDAAGRLWVRTLRWSEVGDARQETVFDVFDPDGAYLGEASIPVPLRYHFPTAAMHGDLFAGAYLADDGEARVGVWRIEG